MNTIIQNIMVFIAVGLALGFLIKKFFWKPAKPKKPCGTDGKDCGCS